MDLQKYIAFANENKLCYLATVEDGQPRVRPMGLWFADERGFYFQSHAEKALGIQLKADKKVEACFYNSEAGPGLGTVLRVSGEIEFLDDIALKKRIFEDRAHIVESYGLEGLEDPRLILFRIYKGEAYFWTMEYNLRESDIEKIAF
jgi:uncharacterized pyridoxamine 5'-phosphate oxidase family protein